MGRNLHSFPTITNMSSRQMRSCRRALAVAGFLLCGAAAHAQDTAGTSQGRHPSATSSAVSSLVGAPAPTTRATLDALSHLPPLPEPDDGATSRPGALARRDPALHRSSAWSDLFTGTWADAKRFPSKDTLQWLAIGAAAAATVRPADKHAGPSIASITALSDPLQPGAVLGSTPLQLGLSALTYGIGRSTGSPRMVAAGADLFRAQLLAQALTMGMKASFRRDRPEGAGYAFPSGHTTVSFASATVLQRHFGWAAGIPAYALASYVALSRVQMERHYLSDVAFGAALGIAAGRSVTIGRTHKLMIAPMPAPGGGGVQFTLKR
jgi:membrane-associated phospholipid phosphatase